MPDSTEIGPDGGPHAPSMLDLIRLSPRLLFPPGGRELYRQVALLADLGAGDEVLVVGSANGVTLQYFVTEYQVQGSGVDFDERMVEGAVGRARSRDLSERLQYQRAPLDHLPYRDEIFDVVVGELGLTARADPEDAVREIVRVARPGGRIVLVQLVWKAPVDEARRRVLGEHLGVQPLMLVEWKRILREAGVEHLHIEDWTDEETAFRPHIAKPFPDFAELFSLPEKIGILRRAWRRWGWAGLRTVLAREREVHRLLTRERILGLTLVTGTRVEEPAPVGAGPSDAEGEPASGEADVSPTTGSAPGPTDAASGEDAEASTGGSGTEEVEEASRSGRRSGADEPGSDAGPGRESGADAEGQTVGLPLFGTPDEND